MGRDRRRRAVPELLASGLTVAQASVVAAYLMAEMRPETAWCSADDLADAPALIEPHEAELAQLDAQLAGTVLTSQCRWRTGVAFLHHDGVEVRRW